MRDWLKLGVILSGLITQELIAGAFEDGNLMIQRQEPETAKKLLLTAVREGDSRAFIPLGLLLWNEETIQDKTKAVIYLGLGHEAGNPDATKIFNQHYTSLTPAQKAEVDEKIAAELAMLATPPKDSAKLRYLQRVLFLLGHQAVIADGKLNPSTVKALKERLGDGFELNALNLDASIDQLIESLFIEDKRIFELDCGGNTAKGQSALARKIDRGHIVDYLRNYWAPRDSTNPSYPPIFFIDRFLGEGTVDYAHLVDWKSSLDYVDVTVECINRDGVVGDRDAYHGFATAGLLFSQKNGVGITGLLPDYGNWTSSLELEESIENIAETINTDIIDLISPSPYERLTLPAIINMSFSREDTEGARSLKEQAHRTRNSALWVVSSDNNSLNLTYKDCNHYPVCLGGFENVLAVTQLRNRKDVLPVLGKTAGTGPYIGVAAPSQAILTSDGYDSGETGRLYVASRDGSSFAAPFVSAVAATIISNYGGLGGLEPSHVKHRIISTSAPIYSSLGESHFFSEHRQRERTDYDVLGGALDAWRAAEHLTETVVIESDRQTEVVGKAYLDLRESRIVLKRTPNGKSFDVCEQTFLLRFHRDRTPRRQDLITVFCRDPTGELGIKRISGYLSKTDNKCNNCFRVGEKAYESFDRILDIYFPIMPSYSEFCRSNGNYSRSREKTKPETKCGYQQ